MDEPPVTGAALAVRRLGLFDAVVIGLGSMIGAGIFTALGPAARAAGSGLLLGVAVAALVAYCNVTSSARRARTGPRAGAARGVLGPPRHMEVRGGKTASCAAMALTVASYARPTRAHTVALTAVDHTGVHKSAWLTRVIVTMAQTVASYAPPTRAHAVAVVALTVGRPHRGAQVRLAHSRHRRRGGDGRGRRTDLRRG